MNIRVKLFFFVVIFLFQINLTPALQCYSCVSLQNPAECGTELNIAHAKESNWTVDCTELAIATANGAIPGEVGVKDDLCGILIVHYHDAPSTYTRTCGLGDEETICKSAIASSHVKSCKVQTCSTPFCNQNAATSTNTMALKNISINFRIDRMLIFIHVSIFLYSLLN